MVFIVSPWKGVVRFGKKGKLEPRFVGPFEIIENVALLPYRLEMPGKLNCVHDTFHVSEPKKPVEILEREFKKLKHSRIAIVKVRWNLKRGVLKSRWEREDQRIEIATHFINEIVRVLSGTRDVLYDMLCEYSVAGIQASSDVGAPAGRPFRCVSDLGVATPGLLLDVEI
ncbi:hypothetical protein Tco_0261604 [Tanacetum coccineum]